MTTVGYDPVARQLAQNAVTAAQEAVALVAGSSPAALSSEQTRAMAAEAALGTAITTETTRGQAAEAALNTGVTSETARAEAAEAVLSGAISTETARAEAAEAAFAKKDLSNAVTPNLDAATLADITANLRLIGIGDNGATPKLFAPSLFLPSIPDLAEVSSVLATDLIEISRSGVPQSTSLGTLTQLLNNNTINLSAAPYNVVADFREERNIITTAGTPYVDAPSALFTSADLGKTIVVSNGASNGGGPMISTIIAIVSATRAQMAVNATNSFTTNRIYYGTDNTAGVRQAMIDAEPAGQYQSGKTIIVPAGGIMTRPFRIRARCNLFGYGPRQSFFYRLPALSGGTGLDGTGVSFVRNFVVGNAFTDPATGRYYAFADDFITITGVGFQGGGFGMPGGDVTTTLEFMSVNGTQVLAQTDPYWRMFDVDVWESPGNGMHLFGRSSSNCGFINITDCNQMGWLVESYDDNVNTVLITGCSSTGLYLGPNGGSNGNFTTMKISFNGAFVTGNRLGTNVTIDGTGFELTGCRLQESNNCNMTIRGSNNKLTGVSIEDTGDISVFGSATTPQQLRAGILLATGTGGLWCRNNRLNNIDIGPTVHVGAVNGQCASHGLFLQGTSGGVGGPQGNNVSFATPTPFGVTNSDGSVTAWTWQNYGAGSGVTGNDSYSYFSQNNVVANGTAVTAP